MDSAAETFYSYLVIPGFFLRGVEIGVLSGLGHR